MYIAWLKGLVYSYWKRLAGGAGGVAITVMLLGTMGLFIEAGVSTMTARAIAEMPVDWQIQLARGADALAVMKVVQKTVPTKAAVVVDYAKVAGFRSCTGQTVQTTGAGIVVGLPSDYQKAFPQEVRLLVGQKDGVLLAQQTAANLHVKIGDPVIVNRYGISPVTLKVAGIVDMPYADSFFQRVGLAPGAAPQAPPDNVVLVPRRVWRGFFAGSSLAYEKNVYQQLHIKLAGPFASDPSLAGRQAIYTANHVEAALAGAGIVGNNLAARLNGVRADAEYAKVLFLFLGLPGTAAAVILTLSVIHSGALRRRKEQALLKIRGATQSRIFSLATIEALLTAVAGVTVGLWATWGIQKLLDPNAGGMAAVIWPWLVAGAGGLLLAVAAVLLPAWQNSRKMNSTAARADIGPECVPVWQKLYLDLFCILGAVLIFWQSAAGGYQLVLAPEGVPQTAVNYFAFLAPFLLWIGGILFLARCFDILFSRGKGILAKLFRPLAGRLAYLAAASLIRQRRLIVRTIALVSLTVAFAVSTAIFNTTYQGQTLVDAELTNGADVTVFGTPAAPAGQRLTALRGISGVMAAQAMQHRYAYVGHDLQDLYGIDPLHLGDATHLSNAYFYGAGAVKMMRTLAAEPDGILVSAETARDYQLHPGDIIRVRLQNGADRQYHAILFHFIGIVKEFPTAPKDSFLVANASYIESKTGLGGKEFVLLKTSADPVKVAVQARRITADLPGAVVKDITQAKKTAGSSLTAINLQGLTNLELSLAILLIAGATGLVFVLQMAERRRSFAILSALGANPAQTGGFLWSEGLTILIGGGAAGCLLGIIIAGMLVKLMTGVFDPPPDALSIPYGYLFFAAFAAVSATFAAVTTAKMIAGRNVVDLLREM
ncbi:abc transporter permease protein domain [Lucifera butyrica]|uniref:Abc transporter permease protein domain n=1 Tax=Lucifera butyrica TaxID=1351585 RepID=A0A498RBE5_9FIRM|nr:FtsX-like permease family protein [Lucifera butyrica]VBB08285.1 abc transporter permease protein domain [Lucifera butyrica]